jgi:hypothetical protein
MDDARHIALGKVLGERVAAPIIAMGRPTFKSVGSPTWELIKDLSKYFLVVLVNEYYTSKVGAFASFNLSLLHESLPDSRFHFFFNFFELKKCPRCLGFMNQISTKDVRHWECPVCKLKEQAFRVNKDLSASVIMARLLYELILRGKRPVQLSRLDKPRE